MIDVRQPEEIVATGVVQEGESQAKNVPLPELADALKLNESDFQSKYEFPKPQLDAEVVFTCRSGVRSMKASLIAEGDGYHKVGNYTGGALEWFE